MGLVAVLLLRCVCRSVSVACFLTSLSVRSGSRPVDLVPPFDPNTRMYTATLGFRMDSYSVDALASDGCEADNAPNQAIPVAYGDTNELNLFAKDPATDERQSYVIRVSRLRGSETQIQVLRVDGAVLSPPFNPTIVSYTAALALSTETIRVTYVTRDADQRVHCEASPQQTAGSQANSTQPLLQPSQPTTNTARATLMLQPTTQTSTTGAPSAAGDAGRRLQMSGEAQYLERHKAFPVDVGFARTLSLTIQSADDMQAQLGTYTVAVTRAQCNMAKPLFDPVSQACVVNCPSAFYANWELQRCARCNTNCAVCVSLVQCQLCTPATVNSGFNLQPDGSCLQMTNRIIDKYRWWCIGFGMFLVIILCLVCVLFCQCICDLCCGSRRGRHEFDSGSDVDAEEADYLRRKGGRDF